MGNRNSRPQAEEAAGGGAPPPPPGPVYAQYPSAQAYRPTPGPAPLPTHYYPPSNGQYYGPGPWGPRPGAPPPPRPPYPGATGPPPPYPHSAPPPAAPPPPPPPAQQLTQTATIRNAVNLKKATLAVAPLSGDPNRLQISFSFDSSAPCVASTYILAEEDLTRGNRLTPLHQTPAPLVRYLKGLGHRFPPGNAEESGSAHVVDLDLHSDVMDALTAAKDGVYPLVVRLEVVTDRGAREGHSLDELTPGGEQHVWVQSQTTFAALYREEDGAWSVRVLKQKIWVEGTSYELQEIYGLEQAGAGGGGVSASGRPRPATTAEAEEERLCVICLVNPRDTTVLPCRHMCLCAECAGELRKQSSKCPICRNHIESLLHIRLDRERNNKAPRSVDGAAEGGEAAAAEAPAATV